MNNLEYRRRSPQAMARHDEILALALRAQARRMHRRLALQSAGMGVLVCGLLLGVRLAGGRPATPTDSTTHTKHADAAYAPDALPASIEIITPSPGDYERFVVKETAPAVEIITDRELIALLRETGRSVGIVRTQGQVHLVGDVAFLDTHSHPSTDRG